MANPQESIPTQQFIGIESIEDGVIKLKSGSMRRILLVSGINFALKSEEEQGIITYAFQGFLNSINFPVQFFVHSRKLNIEDYLEKMKQREAEEENQLLKNQITEYCEFIRSFVSQNAIMQKSFFVIVPYDPLNLPKAGQDVADRIFGWFKSKSSVDEESVTTPQKESLEQMNQRVEQIVNGLNQVGLRAIPLNTEELLELFYNLYNPTTTEKRGVEIKTKQNG